MTQIEKIYRMRRNVLILAFVCSALLFALFVPPLPLKSYQYQILKMGVAILSGILLLIFFVRFMLFKQSTRKDPSLLDAVDDERVKTSWLRAYRTAFYVIVGVHIVWRLIEPLFPGLLFKLGFPSAPWFATSAGLMTLFGMALYFTREVKNG
jgi:hypothetical protein